ncbi:hypothetical protein GCM10009601_16090 [Streptomyces thermospinosisporus]|uniref:Uncharacterized protein n=1 Tax=Streptomyces thermospinosisporus TaxID=161482 RepID=A0ABP4JHK1_9ACTN
MADAVDTEIFSRLRRAGFEVVGRFEGGHPTVVEAFHRVVHIHALPVERISVNLDGAAQLLNDAWKSRALAGGIVSDDGSLLVAGGLNYGWVHVRLTEATDISSLEEEGELLFTGRSTSGHLVCAASKEGSEYWILEEAFSKEWAVFTASCCPALAVPTWLATSGSSAHAAPSTTHHPRPDTPAVDRDLDGEGRRGDRWSVSLIWTRSTTPPRVSVPSPPTRLLKSTETEGVP